MRKALVLTAAFLALPASVRADETATAVIDKAIKAHGGEANLAKFKAGQITLKGSLDIQGMAFEFTQESFYQIPNRFKEQSELDIMGQKIKVTTIINGDKISLNANGMDVDLPEAVKADLKDAIWMLQFNGIVGLKSKDVQVSPIGETPVNGKPAVGVKASAKGHKDVNLYFDKESGLLVKTERRAVDFQTQQEVKEERFVQEYQEVQGVKTAKKILVHRDGNKFLEAEITSVKMLDKLDDNVFQP